MLGRHSVRRVCFECFTSRAPRGLREGCLKANASFFLPWAGIEKAQLESLHYANVKAAEKMARLYDEILMRKAVSGSDGLHALNVFFTRLLFCFFAEDTGIFDKGKFTNAVASLTRADGGDVHSLLEQIFMVLDTTPEERGDVQSYLRGFGYVNGSLFSDWLPVPEFSAKARSIILECGELDWSEINPDIFGSMMQAVVHPGERASLGMHYTSVENIMKVLRPLFLDSLEEAFDEAADDPRKLKKLHDRLSQIKVFDPACGSGNFLVIAYKEIRRFEHRILKRLHELNDDPLGSGLFEESKVKLDHFYGIEIDDFAHEVAKLGLWLAKHQMNFQFEELFGPRLPMIPLMDAGQITCGNAARIDWLRVCPAKDGDEVYVCGNPPYLGPKTQDSSHKSDIQALGGGEALSPNLDYVSVWFIQGSTYVQVTGARLGFVSTNSVCQGDHVGLLFPHIFKRDVEIAFAHTSFLWTNSARGNAGVDCIVLGLARRSSAKKPLYTDGMRRLVNHIGPYLSPAKGDQFVVRTAKPIANVPPMTLGSMPKDGGHLNMTRLERDALLVASPEAEKFVRRYTGANEFLNGRERYCLWIRDDQAAEAWAIPQLAERFEAVRKMRLAGSTHAAAVADRPYRFVQRAHQESSAIIVPSISSDRRVYVPIGFLGPDTVISNLAYGIYGAEPWLYGLLQSRMHMVWLRAVGGKFRTHDRYSNTLVYNTFPVPELSEGDKEALTTAALSVLGVREQFPGKTLAELYDPDKMPGVLLTAHQRLDEVVDRLYLKGEFSSDDERLELLFEMYENLTTPGQGVLSA